ncbi:MAG: hypothetical protein ACTHJS_09280 [Xanthobacteraceae bacterium]
MARRRGQIDRQTQDQEAEAAHIFLFRVSLWHANISHSGERQIRTAMVSLCTLTWQPADLQICRSADLQKVKQFVDRAKSLP